jgi:hypothetical protein
VTNSPTVESVETPIANSVKELFDAVMSAIQNNDFSGIALESIEDAFANHQPRVRDALLYSFTNKGLREKSDTVLSDEQCYLSRESAIFAVGEYVENTFINLDSAPMNLLMVLAGLYWYDGEQSALKYMEIGLKRTPQNSLAQLLDLAVRHNVPTSVWQSSLECLSLSQCIQGAV